MMRAARWFNYLIWNVVLGPGLLAGLVLLFIPGPKTLQVVLPAVLVGAIIQAWHIGRYFVYRRKSRRLMRRLDPGDAALFAGRLDEAERRYLEALAVAGGLIGYVRYALAWTFRRRGKLKEAYAELYHAATHNYDPRGGMHADAAIGAAEVNVLLGDLSTAHKLLEWSLSLVDDTSAQQITLRAKHARATAVLHLRRGEHRRAIEILEGAWNDLVNTSNLETLCELWLWRAFGEAALSSPRDSSAPERWLQLLRLLAPRHLAALAVEWPELGAFLKLHGLDGAPGST
jgi:tetratricopeptide (TPR) repeat protein